jgi:hypothetical protein
VVIDWSVSPRIILVQSPSTTITIQDLYDTLRTREQYIDNLIYKRITKAGGKDDLGGGAFTGVTCTLLDALLQFEARFTVNEQGTVTTAAERILNDSTALFETNGVAVGDLVQNVTDGSFASVATIVGETQIVTGGLSGGSDNQFDLTDSYKIWDIEACSVSGGNLVALDSGGSATPPMLQSFGTHATIAQSTSPALLEGGSEGLTVGEFLALK